MKNLKIITGSALVLLIILVFELWSRYTEAVEENSLLHLSLENYKSDINIKQNEIQSEKKLIQKLSKENKDLALVVLELKKQKEKVKYVNVTKYETKTVTKTVEKLPDSFIFYTEYEMPICKYEKINSSYRFEVLPVEYSASLVVTETKNSVTIKAKSLYDNTTYDIPLESTQTTKIKTQEDQIVHPKASLGLALDSSLQPSSSIGISLFKYKNMNILKANILISENPKIGLSPIAYNFSDSLPLLQNTSLEMGVATDLTKNFIYIGIATEL